MTVNSSGSRTQKVYSRHIPLPPNHKSQSFNTASNSQVPRKLQLIHNCQNLQTFPDSSPGWPLVLSQHMDHYLSVIIWTKWGPLTKIWTRYGPHTFYFAVIQLPLQSWQSESQFGNKCVQGFLPAWIGSTGLFQDSLTTFCQSQYENKDQNSVHLKFLWTSLPKWSRWISGPWYEPNIMQAEHQPRL